MAIDDSEDKIVFVVKVCTSHDELKPKLAYFLTSIPKTFQKVIHKGHVSLTDEVIYTANFNIIGLPSDY